MRISVLDIGATTINLLRSSVGPAGLVKWGESHCFVRLGEGTLLSGLIARDAWNSALSGIAALRACAGARNPDQLVTVATSAIREAINGPAFCAALRTDHGLEVRVLSLVEESALAYRGARSALDHDRSVLVVDLGGGCVNFALGESSRCRLSASLPIGPIRLLPAFAANGVLSRLDAPALSALLQRSLAPTAARLAQEAPFSLVFCSGAARAVRAYATRDSQDPGLAGALERSAVARAQAEVIDARISDLVARGAQSEQADTLGIALTVTLAIMDALHIDRAQVVDRGLREGVALSEHEKLCSTRPDRPSAILRGK
jgi:exopolyphosphatase/guanosine-5'-triphosphate,3'-diphosphate pyrophosphatase